MKYFGEDFPSQAEVVLGLPSFGANGQAALDILITTYHHDKIIKRIGIIETNYIKSISGVEKFTPSSEKVLIYPIEVYSILNTKKILILLRSDTFDGQEPQFATALLNLLQSFSIASLILLTGACYDEWELFPGTDPYFLISSLKSYNKIAPKYFSIDEQELIYKIPLVEVDINGFFLPTPLSFQNIAEENEWRAPINFSDRPYPYGMPLGVAFGQILLKNTKMEEEKKKNDEEFDPLAVPSRLSSLPIPPPKSGSSSSTSTPPLTFPALILGQFSLATVQTGKEAIAFTSFLYSLLFKEIIEKEGDEEKKKQKKFFMPYSWKNLRENFINK